MNYWKEKRGTVMMFLLFGGIFFLTFLLYGLPLSAVLYPFLLCAVIGIAVLLRDFVRKRRKYQQIFGLNCVDDVDAELLPPPDTVMEWRYRQILLDLAAEERRTEQEQDARYRDMVDYYTIWAHQIKTPISAMRLQLQGEDSALTRRLSNELSRIERYVEMVLTFLRLDSETTDYLFRTCSLDDILKKVLRRFSGEFIDRKLTLDFRETGRNVVTDEKWLSFVVEQVLSNALKYTPAGTITVCEKEGRLCISDTGIGIAAEDLPRIFERSYTGGNGRRDHRASGIGLFLCKQICAKLSVPIGITSVPDQGTEVMVGPFPVTPM